MNDTKKKANRVKSEKTTVKKRSSQPTPKKKPLMVDESKVKKSVYKIPLMPLSGVIVFPFSLSPLVVEGKGAVKTAEEVAEGSRLIALFPEIPTSDSDVGQVPGVNPLEINMDVEGFDIDGNMYSKIGVVGRIVKKLRFPDGSLRILVRGLKRIRFVKAVDDEAGIVMVQDIAEEEDNNIETIALAKNALNQFQEIITTSQNFPEELRIAVLNINDNIRLVDLIADAININYLEKLAMLTLPTVHERLQLMTILLNRELEVLHLGSEIQNQVHNALSKSQREYFLREQLRTIKRELGEDNQNPDVVSIEKRLKELKLPGIVEQTVHKEVERLKMMHQSAGEYQMVYTYIDWLLSVPWNLYSEDQINVKDAKKILDTDHYDLTDVKERILEFLAVLQLKKDKKSPILCFVGPPGVGKTSLGKSIAKSMNREFIRISLGGVKDEAEIRGHRRTYLGSLPGRIIQGMKKAGTSNPVFMLDEIDKVGNDFRGDPASALLEVLDPQQNNKFNDHYLELDYDLSAVMFIATANILDTIPSALLDRMEIIRLAGYTPMEKKQIAKRYLIPRQIKENGLKQRQLFFPMETIDHIITFYTREAGVRNLERTFGSICRKVARKIVEGDIKADARTQITPKNINTYLGPQKFFMDEAEEQALVGVAMGMAWTRAGGTLLPIEVTKMPGKGNLKLTGSLGDVMKESAQAAFSYIRSNSHKLRIRNEIFNKFDFHIHVPDGATPKDGPSAGVAMTVALVSLLTDRAVKASCAMTGEITLRGKVTPIGGVKEKVIAALRAGVKYVVLPEKNRKDLEDIPEEVQKKISFKFIEDASEGLKFLLAK